MCNGVASKWNLMTEAHTSPRRFACLSLPGVVISNLDVCQAAASDASEIH